MAEGGAMRVAVLVCAVALVACGPSEKKQAAADAKASASGFTPPEVTSRLDFGGAMERRFKALDRDGSGALSRDELPRAESRLLRFDDDKNGEVGLGEFTNGVMARFDATDLNKDGTVTSEEQETARNLN